jgi:broad specificity polyphosphatase/5'/3'-nucleotidase SurE
MKAKLSGHVVAIFWRNIQKTKITLDFAVGCHLVYSGTGRYGTHWNISQHVPDEKQSTKSRVICFQRGLSTSRLSKEHRYNISGTE